MRIKSVTIGNATLYCGDCFSILPELDIQTDAVVTDPPYGVTDCDWDNPIPLDTFWDIIECRTKLTANYCLFATMKFAVNLVNSKRRWFRYDLIWQKNNKVGFLNSRLMPLRNHETILVFGRPGYQKSAVYNPQKSNGGRAGIKTVNHKSSIYREQGEYIHVSDGSLHPCSVLSFKSEKDKGLHPTIKPVALMEWLVRTYTNKNNLIIDPFMGSGSTGVACVMHNRQFIGIERDKKYFDIACERIRKAYEEVQNG